MTSKDNAEVWAVATEAVREEEEDIAGAVSILNEKNKPCGGWRHSHLKEFAQGESIHVNNTSTSVAMYPAVAPSSINTGPPPP